MVGERKKGLNTYICIPQDFLVKHSDLSHITSMIHTHSSTSTITCLPLLSLKAMELFHSTYYRPTDLKDNPKHNTLPNMWAQ